MLDFNTLAAVVAAPEAAQDRLGGARLGQPGLPVAPAAEGVVHLGDAALVLGGHVERTRHSG